MLLEVIESNKIIYQPYWIEDMPCGKTISNEHLRRVALAGSWGNQVELQAVSDCFNVTVCLLSKSMWHSTMGEKVMSMNHSITSSLL